GQPGLLLAREPERVDAAVARHGHPLPRRRARMEHRREHRLGHRDARHAALDRARLDALPRPPGEHPQRHLPRHRHRDRQRRPGIFARVRVTEYGAGKLRPHERTHPGPREDRLRLTRATNANLSPIFSLYDDPGRRAWNALEAHAQAEPFGETTDDDGTVNRLWRIDDPASLEAVREAMAGSELLIADGHHRYETARVYADEIGGEG